ncbi:hypothetical protein EYF80_007935 [Liparis tanakae]|uniref:Uncharacterized protein n=1 Tax=Liparis tanakae TaxID=230148 RepID=A0A4Z2IVA5_9TELE|nr:hypothetical protein EYF80_007935 [Liparis tanakae]
MSSRRYGFTSSYRPFVVKYLAIGGMSGSSSGFTLLRKQQQRPVKMVKWTKRIFPSAIDMSGMEADRLVNPGKVTGFSLSSGCSLRSPPPQSYSTRRRLAA